MQQNIFLRWDGNLSSRDGNFDEIIEGKKRSTSTMLSDGRWCKPADVEILFIDSSFNVSLPQRPFAFISHPYTRLSASSLMWCCRKLVFWCLMNIDCFRVNILPWFRSLKLFFSIISGNLLNTASIHMKGQSITQRVNLTRTGCFNSDSFDC